jgi:putative methionine-R-sulfoxide reductase with GAF domain
VTGRDYYSPVSFDRETGEPLMTIAVPLTDPRTGRVNSVLIGNFRIRSLSDLLVAQDFDPGQDVYLVAAGETHRAFAERVVAHRNASVVLGDRTFETHDLDAVTTGLEGDEVVAALQVFEVGNQEFTIVAELTTDEAFRDAFESLYTTLAGLAAVVLFTGVVGFVVLRRAMKPMGLLTSAAERLGAGDLSVQVDVRSRTEFGTLAQTFNTMAAQLRDVFGTLEARVQARTRDLQLAAQVSEQAAAILDLDQLLPQVVELVKDNFDLYHAHIYLLDDEKQNLILTAGAGEPGRIMKQRGHYIGINARGLVARAARESEPIIVADVSQDANFLPNPVLPDTRSEAAFPLAVHDRVLGVLDVQSERVGRFDQDILAVLSTLAGQIAVSLDNARLFSEVARASRHEHALTAITQEIQRATNIEEVMQAAARELGKALRVPRTAIQLQLPQGADETEPQPDLHS